jgi:hypothetical protein
MSHEAEVSPLLCWQAIEYQVDFQAGMVIHISYSTCPNNSYVYKNEVPFPI